MGILKNWYDGNICSAEDIAPQNKNIIRLLLKLVRKKSILQQSYRQMTGNGLKNGTAYCTNMKK